MIAFLRRSRIFHAITDNAIIYKNLVGPFWHAAAIETINNEPTLVSTVLGTRVVITEQGIRELLQFNDHSDMPINFHNTFIAGGMQRMGYPGIPTDQYRKANLTKVWRYLMHIFIVCLSGRKAGTDGVSHQTASAMLALVYNKPYNYSGYIFKAMIDNARADDSKWAMYPRFIQLFLNRHHPALQQQGDPDNILRLTPMTLRIWSICASYAKGVQAPVDTPLFGAILDENYVPPPDPQFMNAPAPQQQPFVDVPVQDLQQEPVENILAVIDRFGHVEEANPEAADHHTSESF